MSSSVRSFFKVILSSTFREGKLKLPGKFVKENWDELSESVRLFIPVGRSWCVGVEREIDKTIWLQDGLLKFLEDNSVGIEFFLIFEYEGNSMFNVLIFDLTATEIDYICNSDSAKCCYADQVRVPDTGESGDDEGSEERSIESFTPQISEEPSKSASRNKRRKYVTLRTDKTEDGYISPNKFTVERKDQAENMSFPTSFALTVKAYNLERYILNIPTEFSKLNIPHSTSHVKLFDAADNGWVVRLIHRNKSQCSLTKGWVCFARDKKLMVGDVCVFEGIGGREVKLKVNIYRSSDMKNAMMYKDTSRNDGTEASLREFINERTIEAENKPLPSSFKVSLKPSNIEKHILRVPSYFTPLVVFDSAKVIKLVDADNNQWGVRYINRPRTHALTQGWIKFVRDKKLTVGDICMFERVCCDDEEVKLKVSISKSLK